MLKNLNFQNDGRNVIYSFKRSSRRVEKEYIIFLFGSMALNNLKWPKKAKNDDFVKNGNFQPIQPIFLDLEP